MAFKMKTKAELLGYNAEHSKQKSVVFERDLPKNVMGTIDMDGTIEINKNLSARQKAKAVMHERLHLQQIRDGVLRFDTNNYYYTPVKNKKTMVIPNKMIDTRSRNLPWEVSVIKTMKKNNRKK